MIRTNLKIMMNLFQEYYNQYILTKPLKVYTIIIMIAEGTYIISLKKIKAHEQ